jgi:hypothetical protein
LHEDKDDALCLGGVVPGARRQRIGLGMDQVGERETTEAASERLEGATAGNDGNASHVRVPAALGNRSTLVMIPMFWYSRNLISTKIRCRRKIDSL